jgi:hypothetical protein
MIRSIFKFMATQVETPKKSIENPRPRQSSST